MKHSYTQNDLVSYIYNEMTLSETREMEKAMAQDWNLQSAYLDLKAGYDLLPSLRIRPSLSSIKSILKYSSKSLAEVSC